MSIANPITPEFVLQQFDNAYEQSVVAQENYVSGIMGEWPTQRPTERYTYLESVPHMRIWRRNEPREAKAFRAVAWNVDTFDYSIKVEWNRNDNQDHQGRRSIQSKAMTAGNTAASMKVRIATQMLEGATNFELLPSIPLAPDGAAIFATTAGGQPRFGATNGNLLPGTGVAAGNTISDDYFSAIQQFMLFKDTEGEPLWDPTLLQQGVTIMFPVGLQKVFTDAFQQARPFRSDANGAAAPTTIAQEVRIAQGNIPITLWPNPHLTDASDWYVFMSASPVQPLFRGVQQALQSDIYDRSNSDRARDEKVEGVGWDARWSHGVGPVYQSIKINN